MDRKVHANALIPAANHRCSMGFSSRKALSILPCDIGSDTCALHATSRNQIPRKTWSGQAKLSTALESLRLSLHRREKTGETAPYPVILNLPVELILEIARHLDLHERITLALTCKAFHAILGSQSFQDLKDEGDIQLKDLVTLLHRDSPTHRLCTPCKTLHGPSSSTLLLPPNKLSKTQWHPDDLVYIFPPSQSRNPKALYWLTKEHIARVLSKEICTSTLCCEGRIDVHSSLPKTPGLKKAIFQYTARPVVTRKTVIYHSRSCLELVFAQEESSSVSQDTVRALLSHADFRCCMHCSTALFLDDLVCGLFHDPTPDPQDPGCWQGCGRHSHDCGCVTAFEIENMGNATVVTSEGVRWRLAVGVRVWQWLDGGRGSDDKVLRYKGILRLLYDDALYELG